MKLFRYSAALGLGLFFAVANRATAIDMWYDFEGDSGTIATDKLTSDGAQNGTAVNAVTLNAPAVATSFRRCMPASRTHIPSAALSTLDPPW